MTNDHLDRPGQGEDPSEDLRLSDIWATVRRNRWLILGTSVATIGATALYTSLQAPVYESETTLRLSGGGSEMSLLERFDPLSGGTKADIETELVVLQSRQIAEPVVDSLALHVQVQKPVRRREEILRVLEAPRTERGGSVDLRLQDDGSYAVDGSDPARSRVEVGRSFRLAGVVLEVDPAVRRSPPDRIRVEVRPYDRAVKQLREALTIQRADNGARVVTVRYRSTDPVLAAAVPNAIAYSFMRYQARISKAEALSSVEFLREQVAAYEQQLREAEAGLRDYREEARIVSPREEATVQVERLAQLQARRDELRAERDALAALLARVQASSERNSSESSPYRQLASFPVFLSNRAIQDVLQSITHLENQRAELLVRRTSANADVQGISERIGELEAELFQVARSYLQSIDGQLASVEANLARFDAQLTEIPAREVEFARHLRRQTLLEELYALLQKRLKEAEIQYAMIPGDATVIDPALIPEEPIAPRPLRNLLLGSIFGFALGLGIAFTRQALDTRVRTPQDAEISTRGLPLIGTIPRIRVRGAPSSNGNGNGKRPGRIRLGPPALGSERLVAHRDPRSPTAEAYRALRTNLIFSAVERAPQVLVVTSALPGDGKSTTSANLAITLAQQGTRTLLVDADLRRGTLHTVFGVNSEPGLTHVLFGRMSVEAAVQEVPIEGSDTPLSFLGAGVFPPNPAEILGSSAARQLIEELRGRYEVVIFDAPPLNLVTDAAVLGRVADATILVARAGATDKNALQQAASQLSRLGTPIGGVVLNDFDHPEAQYSYYGSESRN